MQKQLLALFLFTALTAVACEESNPYKDGSVQTGTLIKSGDGTAATGTGGGDGGAAAPGDEVAAAPNVAADTKKAADPSSSPALTGAAIVCADQDAIAKYKVEMEVLCVNGQPSQAFANALTTTYKGSGTVNLGVIKSVDNAGISTFVIMSGIEIPKGQAELLAKKAALNPANITEGNATYTQAETKAIPAAGGKDLGAFELTANLSVRVAIANVQDVRALTRDYVMLKEGSVLRSATFLTPGAADNADNIVANIVSFWITEGNTTKIIGVTHQQANNRGQHPTAETTIMAVGRRTVTDGYNALVN